jgi:hypothetical protein
MIPEGTKLIEVQVPESELLSSELGPNLPLLKALERAGLRIPPVVLCAFLGHSFRGDPVEVWRKTLAQMGVIEWSCYRDPGVYRYRFLIRL